uniref:uncharacterized protein LOC122597941 isoform X2 n=1 Tax=Erigeron canadensis TaxID=72917 RepID=UPI001CB92F09|nr:uncharacterized protein LOC122597941 isoform X2 [Erigeron canadensis]
MEIDLFVEDCTEPGEFVNFSIREYVSEMRNKDPMKCWPFQSLADPNDHKLFLPNQNSESTSLSTQFFPEKICDSDDTPEHNEAANSPEVDILSGKEDQPLAAIDMIRSLQSDNKVGIDIYDESSGQTCSTVTNSRHKNSVDEDAKFGSSVASDNIGLESRRKPRRYRLLSDIYRDPASKMGPRCDITNHINVNHKFVAETEDEMDNDVTLYELVRKQKGVQVTDPTVKKKRRRVRVEEPRVDQGKKLKRKFRDTSVSDLEIGPESHVSKKTIIDDTESKTMAKSSTVKALTQTTIIPKNEGDTSCLGSKENAFLKQKDGHLPCPQKANIRETTESPNEDFEMEAVMLLAYHFKKENSSANGQVLHEIETNTTCARVHKNIQEHSTPSVKKSIMKTSSVLSADKQKTFIKEKLEDVFCSVQMKDHSKGTTASVLQAHIETCMMKAAAIARDAQNCSVLLCSVNRNPADFSIPNARNKFMRGCK